MRLSSVSKICEHPTYCCLMRVSGGDSLPYPGDHTTMHYYSPCAAQWPACAAQPGSDMSHGWCQAGTPATRAHHAADCLQRLDSPPCTAHENLSLLHHQFHGAGVKGKCWTQTMCNVVNRSVAKAAHIFNLKITVKWKAVPKDGEHDGHWGFTLSAYCSNPPVPSDLCQPTKVHITSKDYNTVTFTNILEKVMAIKMEEISYFLTQNLGCAAISQQGWEQTMACSFPLLS